VNFLGKITLCYADSMEIISTQTSEQPKPPPNESLESQSYTTDPPESKQELSTSMHFKKNFALVAGLFIIFMLAVVFICVYKKSFGLLDIPQEITLSTNPSLVSNPTATIPAQQLPTKTAEPTTQVMADQYSQTYTSEALGIAFDYAPEVGTFKAVIKEDGRKISVGDANSLNDQYIEVFTTKENVSIIDNVTNTLLADYSLDDCRITEPLKADDPINSSGAYPLDENFLVFTIEANVDYSQFSDLEALSPYFQKCPVNYLSAGGIQYFAYDTRVPNKYIFYTIGQYPAWSASSEPDRADKNLTWIQTIRFIEQE
jgi:hypothetical protein